MKLVQVRNIITFELKVFRHEERERHTIFLCWLLLHCQLPTQPMRGACSAQIRLASPSSESQLSRSEAGTQLTAFSQISAHASSAWRHPHPLVSIPIWNFYFDISEWHILSARVWTPALMLHLTNPWAKWKVLSLTKLKGKIYKTKSLSNYITLANIPTQVKSLHHSLEQVAESIDLHVNADKMEYMCFNQEGAISTLNVGSLKLVDKFMYFSSSISSTESDVSIHLTKTWTSINRLTIIWKSDQYNKIKQGFFQAAAVSILLYGSTTCTPSICIEKKLDRNSTSYTEQILEPTPPRNNSCMAAYLPSLKLSN